MKPTTTISALSLGLFPFAASAEVGQLLPKDDKVKLLVKYTNSQGKFSTTLISERNMNPFDPIESVIDRIASSARPISIKERISQVEVDGDVDGAIEALLADDEVDEVELDFPMYKFQPKNVTQEQEISRPDLSRRLEDVIPYGVNLVQAPELWSVKRKPKPVKVCIVDTGYDKTHNDLPKEGITSSSTNFADAFSDGDGHGTHIAGIIGALGNERGVVGVNPNPRTFSFHIAKALGDDGRGSSATVIEGIEGCLEAGAQVITLSLGGGKRSNIQEALFKKAYDEGVLVFAASGNSGSSNFEYPASYPYVISVAAVNEEEKYANFSNFNEQVELVGPGVNIKSTLPGNTYGILSGTSMGAPYVAGAAALIWSFYPECSNSQIRNVLALTAKDVNPSSKGCNFRTGFGLIQAKAAYDMLDTYGCNAGGLDSIPLSEGVQGGCHDLPAKPETIAVITGSPSSHPISVPSLGPTSRPSIGVTAESSDNPSLSPLRSPSKGPSASPSFKLFKEPVMKPSSSPTRVLPYNKTVSTNIQAPSPNPSVQPSRNDTSNMPSQNPSSSVSLSEAPSSSPSMSPTFSPPTKSPSLPPSSTSPSAAPSMLPTANPSRSPSSMPTKSPSLLPSITPSSGPSQSPSLSPSTNSPSKSPSTSPAETSTLVFKNANCKDGEVSFSIDFTFAANPSQHQIYWFLIEKCSRQIIFDCQDCYKAEPFPTHSFEGCVPEQAGYIFYFNDYSGKSWSEGGYVITYAAEYVFNSTGNVGSSEEVFLGTQEVCSKPPTAAPTSSSPTSSAPTSSCAQGERRLHVEFNLDEDPSSVYWFLIDRCTGPLLHDCQACFTGSQPYAAKSFSKCLPDGHYSFIFHDYSGKKWTQGGYTVTYGDEEIFDSSGDVKHSQEVYLGNKLDCPVPIVTSAPETVAPTTRAPTALPTPALITSAPITSSPINHSTGCPANQMRVDIQFDFDADPSKTYWYIIDRCAGKLVYDCQGCYANSQPGSSKYFYRCVPESQYSFVFNDYSGTKWQKGGYTISYNRTKIIDTKGNVQPLNEVKFGHDFCQQSSPQPTMSPTSLQHKYCEVFNLDIVTDSNPSEISWTLQEIGGDDLGIVSYGPAQNQKYYANSVYISALTECLSPGEYQFSIHDDGGDGINNPGYYKIYLNGISIREGRDFGTVESTGFIIVDKSTNSLFDR